MQAAASHGRESIFQMPLNKGADANIQGGGYGNALQLQAAAAFRECRETMTQVLLDKGVNANAQDGKYGNALQAAFFKGHGKIVQMLLEKGDDVNA